MQQVFPEDEVRFLVSELMQTLETARQKATRPPRPRPYRMSNRRSMLTWWPPQPMHRRRCSCVVLHDKDGEAEAYVRLGRIKLLQCENLHALEAFKKAGVALDDMAGGFAFAR